MGLLDIIAETQRASRADDEKYLKAFVYFFELRIPQSVAKGPSTLLYPLILAPDSYRMTEPYSIEVTPTNRSGFWIEENGILARDLVITGTTGFKPRRFSSQLQGNGNDVALKDKRFSRSATFAVTEALSGQKHFQFLQDVVMRTYAELKSDPDTAHETELFFHNVKDDEHWRVHPKVFEHTRQGSSPLYKYTITLVCSEGAAQRDLAASEDFEILEALQNANLIINSAVQQATSVFQNLTAVISEIDTSMRGIATVAADAANIVDAAAAVQTQGFSSVITSIGSATAAPFTLATSTVRAAIAVPYAYVTKTLDALDAVLAAYDDALLLGAPATVPDSALNNLRRLGDSLAMILCYPSKFQNSFDAAVARFQTRAELSTAASSVSLALAADQSAPASLYAFGNLGTGLLPGDQALAGAALGLGLDVPRFRSAFGVTVQHGDTLQNLAARYLDDARRWRFLALFNDLTPPFISTAGLPGTLGVGDTILIPSTASPLEDEGTPAVYGAKSGLPPEEAALGCDFELRLDDRGFFDFVPDVEGGNADAKLVRGIPCLAQGLRSRVTIERGTDAFYKRVGYQRVVGLGLTAVDYETAKLRLVEAVQADPRVSAVRAVAVQGSSDTLAADLEVAVRGLAQSQRITVG